MTSALTILADRRAGQGRTTDRLRRLLSELPSGGVTLGSIIDRLGASATGLCLLLLSVTSFVPGIAPVLGLALCTVAFGMVIGRTEPLLPDRLRRWTIQRDRLQHGVQRLTPPIAWLERWLHPRATWLLHGTGSRLVGMASLLNGVLIVLPIPFGNTAPAIAQLILSLGLVVGDGFAIGVGLLATIIAVIVDIGMIALGYTAIISIFQSLF